MSPVNAASPRTPVVMPRLLLMLLAVLWGANPVMAAATDVTTAEPEYVVVLHGLGRTARAMRPLAERIAQEGYRVFNVAYPSRDLAPAQLVKVVQQAIADCCMDARRLHFVTHSLGGILVRARLAVEPDPRVGRVVMLSPPNQGTELVDTLGKNWWFEAVMGPTAKELGTGPDSLPNRLPPPDVEVGIIAATGSINPLGSLLIPGEDDGIVALCRMWLEGAQMIAVEDSHAMMMRSPDVARQVLLFIAEGRFDHATAEPVLEPPECADPEA
ncbi:MAG: alpha/beta fold hydrolase [Gammaproteobacteria bacterium]|nr:MAG: alpha/beta fold hydrolase [Gammaproteobacteria bacterium]